jgi:hypothetical protein
MREPEKFIAAAGDPISSVSGKLELKLGTYAVAFVDVI